MRKITLLLALLAFATGNAQWTTDTAVNTLVAVDPSSTDSKSIGTSDGKTFIVFWKVVPDPTNYELRLQLIDSNGVPQFGADGMLISNTIPMSTYTVFWKMTIDKSNNLYVGVTGTGTGSPGIVYKIDTNGTMLWGPDGVNLGSAYLPTILPLDTGETVISYYPGSQKSKIQKFTAAGVPVWPAPIDVASGVGSSSTVPADLYEMANHDVVLVFHRRLGFGVGSNLFAQRYSYNDGTAIWTSPTQIADKGTFYNATYSGTQDGDAIFYGYSATTGTGSRFDSYVLRLNGDGTLPWGINGVDFDINQNNYEMNTKIACTPGASNVWAIARYTPSTQNLYGEYVQKFNKITGTRQLTDTAKEVFSVDANNRTHISDLFLVNDNPLFLIKSGYDDSVTPTTLSIVQLDATGGFTWPGQTFPIATFAANKGRVSLNTPYNGQVVATFSEARVPDEPRMYAQNFANVSLDIDTFQAPENTITLYPNPSNGIFNIKGNVNIKVIKVVDLLGQEVYHNKQVNEIEITIDATTWAKGLYIITAETDTTIPKSFKLVKS